MLVISRAAAKHLSHDYYTGNTTVFNVSLKTCFLQALNSFIQGKVKA